MEISMGNKEYLDAMPQKKKGDIECRPLGENNFNYLFVLASWVKQEKRRETSPLSSHSNFQRGRNGSRVVWKDHAIIYCDPVRSFFMAAIF